MDKEEKGEKRKKKKAQLGACNMNNLFSDSKYFIETQKIVMHMKAIALKEKLSLTFSDFSN